MSDGLILRLLVEAALRSLLLGAGVLVLLRLVRLRDARAEALAWTIVLLASLAMPFLSHWLPGLFIVHLPTLPGEIQAIEPRPASAAVPASVGRTEPMLAAWLWLLYRLVVLAGLARLALGLALTQRIYWTARPIKAEWASKHNVRVSSRISAPLSFGSVILLPADFADWPQAMLAAVLAHEESHLKRGDFFVQLLAQVHRAVFWFNPFAWWLQARLGELAETVSDEAAIQRLQDAPRYAEILLDVSRKARPVVFLRGGALGMAQSGLVVRRLNHILDWRPHPGLGLRGRFAGLLILLGAALALAGVHAAPLAAPARRMAASILAPSVRAIVAPIPEPVRRQPSAARPAPFPLTEAAPLVAIKTQEARPATPEPPAAEPETSYNPLALLDGPEVVVLGSAFILTHPAPPSD